MCLVGLGAEMRVHIRDELIHEHGLESGEVEFVDLPEHGVVGHAVCHHDDERLDFAFCDEVVHYEVGVALV